MIIWKLLLRSSAILRSRSQTIAKDRTMFYLKAGFHMIADRRSQTIAIDRRRSQGIEHGSIFCDRLRSRSQDRRSSFHMIADDRRPYCDLRSAICCPRSYGNQPLDRTCLSSTIVCDHDRRIADDRRPYCDLRSAIIWKPAFSHLLE